MIFQKVFENIHCSVENYKYSDISSLEISDIIYDSRKVKKGCVFVCLKGSKVDGHKFAKQAVDLGASVIVSQKKLDITSVPVVLVTDTRLALALISANFFSHPARELKTIGITGTKGKTTTACMIKSILEKNGSSVGMIGTLGVVINNQTFKINNTTPESYEIQYFMRIMADSGCDCVVMEVSSLGLKWFRVAGFEFDIGVFTNFAPDHIGENEHSSMDEYKYCKSLLFRDCKKVIANIDDKSYQDIIKGRCSDMITFGFAKSACFSAENEELIHTPGKLGVGFDLCGKRKLHIDVSIPGKFSVYNALAAIAVCDCLEASDKSIVDGLSDVNVKGRVEMLKINKDYTLLIDYAHNALSMENILTTLKEYKPNRLVCLFGAGGNRAKSRRYEMGEVCGKYADLSVITADNSRFENVNDIIADIQKGMSKTDGKSVVIPDRKEAIRFVISTAQKNDIIVLAGKGHEDYQEINGVKYHFDEREIVSKILEELK